MIAFGPRTLTESIKRLWPPYRRRKDEEMREAISKLVRNPDLPCMVDGYLVPHGFGLAKRERGENPWWSSF